MNWTKTLAALLNKINYSMWQVYITALNYEGIGRPLAEIVDKNYKFKTKKKCKVVSLAEGHEMGKVKDLFNHLELQPNQLFMKVPNEKKKRSVIYASWQSGSGKAYYTADYVKKICATEP